jgi:hypothetical protein
MDPFIELMQAGALIMLLFAAVLIAVVLRNTSGATRQVRIGPGIVGIALLFFAVPIYAAVIGASNLDRFTTSARVVGAILLPVGLYLLGSQEESAPTFTSRRDEGE